MNIVKTNIRLYHTDHLGSTALVTDLDGEVTQHVAYIPYGEIFVEQRNGSWSSPYLFNAKELDEETGLYYYGARYLDPADCRWLSPDPKWDDYKGVSPYAYCLNNPVKLVDPDGRKVTGDDQTDANMLVNQANDVLKQYEDLVNGISDYLYADGNEVKCRYKNLSPLLSQINARQKDGTMDEQTANDLRDLLYGYTAAIAHPNTISFTFASDESNSSDFEYACQFGWGVTDIQRDANGNMNGMRCSIAICEDGSFNDGYGSLLFEVITHEIVGHGANGLYNVPGYRDVESIKYSDISRRLSGKGERSWAVPHEGDPRRMRIIAPHDRALIGGEKYWKQVVKYMKGR